MGGGQSSPTGDSPDGFENKTSTPATSAGESNSPSSSSSSTSPSGGASSSTSANVTDGDVSEINDTANEFIDSINPEDPSDGPSPAEFAKQTFADGVQARRIEAGYDGHQSRIDDMDATEVGTWNSFDSDDIVEREDLHDAVDISGRTSSFMEEVTLSPSDGRAATEAYVTKYDHNQMDSMTPSKENAQSQMAVSAALDAMGVQAPRHHFDSETKEVFVESVSRPGYDTEIAEDLSQEYADRVDPEQMKDMMAANIVVGNTDVKPDNLMVGEDGKIATFDYDYTGQYASLKSAKQTGGRCVDASLKKINRARSEPLGITTDEVFERSEEIATQLRESGAVERVAEAAQQYDDYFNAQDDADFGGSTRRGNATGIGNRIRVHAHSWGNDTERPERRGRGRPPWER